MTKESGSTPKRSKRVRLPQMKYPDASHPIYSNPTVIIFGKHTKGSSPDSEIPEPGQPSPASHEPSDGKED